MAYTYPPPAPTITGDVTTINRFLQTPTLVARRLRTILVQRYIADALLTGRFTVSGGAVQYETGESIFSGENPRAVNPLMEYPQVSPGGGTASIAKTVKWGQDAPIADESIKRRQMDPVNRALTKLANQNVKYIDSVALAAIASVVTNTSAAAASWATATAAQILLDVALTTAQITALNEGFDPDTVVVDDINYAYAMAKFAAAGYLPRESNADNPVLTGEFPVILGKRWLATPNLPVAGRALVVDSTQLGGMADEDLGGPGYVKVEGIGVEVKTIRDDDNDGWKVRARRVTVPVVVEPGAGRFITGL